MSDTSPSVANDAECAVIAPIEKPETPPIILREVVYTPESELRRPYKMVSEMFTDLFRSRELAWRMFVRDTKAAYRQSYFGYLWIFAPPILSMLMFGFLHSRNILNIAKTPIPYPAFVLVGTLLWEAFTGAIKAPIGAIKSGSSMLTKLNFPREALLLTSLYHLLFSLGLKLLLLIPAFLYFGVKFHAVMPLGILAIFGLILLGYTLGLLLVPLGLLYNDVGRILTMALGGLFLLTPVVYPPPTSFPASLVNNINPISPLLTTARELITGMPLTQGTAALVIVAITLIVFFLGWSLFRVALPHLIARMSA